jgi:hypothetical protein
MLQYWTEEIGEITARIHDSQSSDRDSTTGLPEFETAALTTTQCLVSTFLSGTQGTSTGTSLTGETRSCSFLSRSQL